MLSFCDVFLRLFLHPFVHFPLARPLYKWIPVDVLFTHNVTAFLTTLYTGTALYPVCSYDQPCDQRRVPSGASGVLPTAAKQRSAR